MIWACIVVGVLLLLYLLFFLENRRFATTFTTYESKKIETQFRIVQVSDLHDRSFGKEQVDLMYAIRQAKPDCIVITGDLFNRHKKAVIIRITRPNHRIKIEHPLPQGLQKIFLKEMPLFQVDQL